MNQGIIHSGLPGRGPNRNAATLVDASIADVEISHDSPVLFADFLGNSVTVCRTDGLPKRIRQARFS
jgi:hypothetical protein